MQAVDTRSFDEILATPMTKLEELECVFCELYKDVYGVRARWYRAESLEQARKDIEQLSEELKRQMAYEKAEHLKAIVSFRQMAAKHCGGNVEDAKRWQHQAYGTNGDDEYLCYQMGLPYGYFKQAT